MKEILINSMFLLNCKITSWYYYLIFYYNPNKNKCNVNEKVIKMAKNVEILFFNPLNKQFFDIKLNELKKLELTNKANLDNFGLNFGNISLNLRGIYDKDCNLIIGKDIIEKSFKEDFGFLINNARNKNTVDIIEVILNIMEIKGENYILKHKIEKLPGIVTYPSYDFIYLYKREDNKGFLGVKTIKDNQKNEFVKVYDLKQKKEVNFFENNCEYFYTLQKKRKPRLNLFEPVPNKINKKTMKNDN